MNSIMVSIVVTTYNHSQYIEEALDSLLMQKTEYIYEIIIPDDASTDNNQEIIQIYQKRYPDIIKPILRKKNIGPNKNFLDALNKCRGKYISQCEGDDYWTDPTKIQKQVDFLENNPDYGLVHSDYDEFYQQTGYFNRFRNRKLGKVNTSTECDVYLEQLNYDRYQVRTVTECVRADIHKKAISNLNNLFKDVPVIGDYPKYLELSKLTKFKYFDESMAVHRIVNESASHTEDYQKKIKFIKSSQLIQDYFIKKYPCPEDLKNKIYDLNERVLLHMAVKNMDKHLAEEVINSLYKKSVKKYVLYLASFIKPLNKYIQKRI